MRKAILLLAVSFVLSSSAVFAESNTTLDAKVWRHDMKQAHQVAIAQGKPMIIVFGASWCRYCKKLERETLSDPQLDRFIQQNFVPVHLDLDEEKKIGKILEVKSLPCTVVLSPKADLLGKIVGFKDVKSMHEQLQKSLKTHTVIQQATNNGGTVK